MGIREILLIIVGAAVLLGAVLMISSGPSIAPVSQGESPLSQNNSTSTQSTESSQSSSANNRSVQEIQDEIFQEHVNSSPEWNSQLRMFGDSPDPLGDQIDDISPAAEIEGLEFSKASLATLRNIDLSALSFDEQTSTNVFSWYFDDLVRRGEFMFYDYLIAPGFGAQNGIISFMTDVHEVKSKLDADNYIARLRQVDTKMDQAVEGVQRRKEAGVLLPSHLMGAVIGSVQGIIAPEPADNPLHSSFLEKLNELDGLSEQEITTYSQTAQQIIKDEIYPAYERMITWFQGEVDSAPGFDEVGVWRFPRGEEYYEYLVRRHTTSDMTAEEAHQIGLNEVARIQEEMRGFLEELGYTGQETFGALYAQYRGAEGANPELNYPQTPESRDEAVADYNRHIADVLERLEGYFNVLPEAPVEVWPVPDYQEATSPGAYYRQPSFDGSRPGVFFINLGRLPFKPGMQTLTYHEAVPGHHFQLALMQESDHLPTFQKIIFFTSHAEGWALYAEKLAREIGMYTDAHSKLSNRWSELFRAVRLVVDTGLHYKRWSRDETITYMTDNLGFPIAREVDRYIVIPGQALAYKSGELKIIQLRQRAEQALGSDFAISEFHDVVLLNGGMPMSILEEVVDHYIEAKLASQ
jgi:uncharacterized protein (DUF885 family)